MKLTRRAAVKAGAATIALSKFSLSALADSPDLTTDKIPPRIPLHEFVQDPALMAALCRGVRAMKARAPSDPLSWFFQASIHGVTIDYIRIAAAKDPNLIAVDQKKFWNQCPHFGQASANFLPWHRAYTYYFERILRAHTGEPRFALPYWDYHRPENSYFPREFGMKKLEQPLDGDDSNPLYHAERNLYFTDWQHWSDPNYKPYSQLTPEAVDWSRARDAKFFFGAHERDGLGGAVADEDVGTRGLLESFPHDPIHRLVGGVIPRPPLPNPDNPNEPIPQQPVSGGMASPPTAGFDPIFCVHHSNLDRLWAEWSCLPAKEWGQFPPQDWFDDDPWHFFDVVADPTGALKAKEVNLPRKTYFDFRAMGIAFKYEDATATPLQLPDPIPPPPKTITQRAPILLSRIPAPNAVLSGIPTSVSLRPARAKLRELPSRLNELTPQVLSPRVLLRLTGINLSNLRATGFEVHLVGNANARPKRGDSSFIGTIPLFRHDDNVVPAHNGPHAHKGSRTETFDITSALDAAIDPATMSVVVVPYSLSATRDGNPIIESGALRFDAVELLAVAQEFQQR